MEEVRSNPFPGLRPFNPYYPEEQEQHLFFGREGQSTEILRRLRETRFLAVVGTSGSGKSSLIRAGLLPDLDGGFLAGGADWRMAIFRPIGDPLGNMARALNKPKVLQTEALGEGEEEQSRSDMLMEVTLRRSGLGLVEATRLARLSGDQNLLVVVDQFEELFRFANTATTTRQADDAAAFVKLLLEATRQTEVPLYVVITMRSDFIGDCARYQDLPEAVTAGMYLVPRMTREQRREAIQGPVAVEGGTIAPRLVNRLLNEAGDNPDQLPVLQHALMRTWDHWAHRTEELKSLRDAPLDVEDYDAIGGLENALSNHADEAYNALPSEGYREIARRMFQCLTEKGADNREVRRPTSVGNIATVAHATLEEVIEVVEEFRKQGRSFLNTPERGALAAESLIDISHESLIRQWKQLKKWVNEEAESASTYRRLADASERHDQGKADLMRGLELQNNLAWRERDRPTAEWAQRYAPNFEQVMAFLEKSRDVRDAEEAEKERQRKELEAEKERRRREELRRAKRNLLVVSAFSVVAIALAVFGWIQKDIARRKADEASAATAIAEGAKRDAIESARIAKEKETEAKWQRDAAERAERERNIEGMNSRQLRWDTTANEVYLLDQLIQMSHPKKAADWHIWKASLLLKQDRLDEAKDEADKAIQAAPDSYEARTVRGYMYMLKADPAKAITDFYYIRDHINPRLPLNSLNLTVALAELGKHKEARQAVDQAIQDAKSGDNTGGTEEQVPPEVREATGRTVLVANADALLAALYYLRANLDFYVGAKDFSATLLHADQEIEKLVKLGRLRSADLENAGLVALTWAWLHEKVRPQDYGTFAVEGGLWERVGYPDFAKRRLEKFQAAHAQHGEARYSELASWAGMELAVLERAGPSARSAPRPMEATEMALESQVFQSKKRFPEAEKWINQAIDKDRKNTQLYLQRVRLHFTMAKEVEKAERDLNTELSVLQAQIQKLIGSPEATAGQLATDPNAQTTGKTADQQAERPEDAGKLAKLQELQDKEKLMVARAANYKAEAKKIYLDVIKDCNDVITLQPGAAAAYVERAYANYYTRWPAVPLASDDPILRDLRRGLSLTQHRSGMSSLIYLLTGSDLSKISEDDPRLEEALRKSTEFDQIFPGDADNLAKLAELQFKKKMFHEALRSIEAAINVEGSNLAYYETRAKVEEALGMGKLRVERQRARGYRRAADILRWTEKNEDANEASRKSWEPMGVVAKEKNNEEVLCNSEVTICTESRAMQVSSEWILSAIDSIKDRAGSSREAQIDRGSEDGIVILTRGDLYSMPSEEAGHERRAKKIGTGEVLSVEPHSALVRVTMDSPAGDGLVRLHDGLQLKARVPEGQERSSLWKLAKFHVTLLDLDKEKILDYRTLYPRETPELDSKLFKTMLDDIHAAGKLHGKEIDKLLDGTLKEGNFKDKTLRQAFVETNRDHLEKFLKYALKYPGDYFGREWKLVQIYATWVLAGTHAE